jgi:hypothetical protein
MWINDDVDIPEALLAAQRDGRLVIFAGAGVSMGPPSNLPGFSKLAKQIAAGVLTPSKNEPGASAPKRFRVNASSTTYPHRRSLSL